MSYQKTAQWSQHKKVDAVGVSMTSKRYQMHVETTMLQDLSRRYLMESRRSIIRAPTKTARTFKHVPFHSLPCLPLPHD